MFYLIALYATLGHPDYDRREYATEALIEAVRGTPWYYGPRLCELAKGATEPETLARVRRPIAAWNRWRAAAYVPSGVPVWPMGTCYPYRVRLGVIEYDIRDREALCEEWVDDERGPNFDNLGPEWPQYRKVTENHARLLIATGSTAAEVDALLLRMWKLEQADNGDYGFEWARASKGWNRWEGGYPRPR